LGGFSIGFDFRTIGFAHSIFEGREKHEPRMVEVVYGPDKHVESFDYVIEQTLQLFSDQSGTAAPGLIGELRRFICQDISTCLLIT
jgi:hypothetical protein